MSKEAITYFYLTVFVQRNVKKDVVLHHMRINYYHAKIKTGNQYHT